MNIRQDDIQEDIEKDFDSSLRNIYLPAKAKVISTRRENDQIKTLRVQLVNKDAHENFMRCYKTGMFGMFSVFGEGECPLCIASPQTKKEYIECTFRKIGRVTSELFNVEEGEYIGLRGPYGNYFPVDEFKGKDILFVAGGIGIVPIRSLILHCLDESKSFGRLNFVYGVRKVSDLIYQDEISEWKNIPQLNLILTVDPGGENSSWQGKVGLIPHILEEEKDNINADIAVICGPPVMIKFSISVLESIGFSDKNIYTTLENRMKCGLGKCGRCNIGPAYVCKDGPVFTVEELKRLPQEEF